MNKLTDILADYGVFPHNGKDKDLETAINKYISEIIGEDEDLAYHPVGAQIIKCENKLRAEQRLRAGVLVDGEKPE